MKIQSVNNYSGQSFGALNRDAARISEPLFNVIKSYPVVDSFSKKFDATMGVSFFLSKSPERTTQMALSFENVKPRSIFAKVFELFKDPKQNNFLLKTKATNTHELLTELECMDKKTLINLYSSK